jgi:hypothetical protein
MKSVIYNHNDAVRFVHKVSAKLGDTFEKPQIIECKLYRPPRTLPQNAKLHAMIGELAANFGYSASELKDWLKWEYGPKKEFSFRSHRKMIPKSTAEYSKLEMIEFIGQVDRIATENGFTFSHDAP